MYHSSFYKFLLQQWKNCQILKLQLESSFYNDLFKNALESRKMTFFPRFAVLMAIFDTMQNKYLN